MTKRQSWLTALLALVIAISLLGCGGTATPTPTVPPAPAVIPAVAAKDPETATTTNLTILYTNDFHGAIAPQGSPGSERGGLVNLASLIGQIRAEAPGDTLVLDAGDTFQGTYLSNSNYGQVVLAAMNLAGYDAWTLGNHEFDWGQQVLRTRIAEAGFPVLAANVHDLATGELWDAVQPYALVEAGGLQVAILGLTYPDTPTINKPQNVTGLEFSGAIETAQAYLPELQSQADLIVVLSHLGLDGDRALARAVDGLDLIVGGHSHAFLDRPETVDGTLLVQAGAKGQVLGRLDLTVDRATGQIEAYRGDLLPVNDDVAPDPEVQAPVDAALAEAAETMDEPIGEAARPLDPRSSGEFALGNLICDALRAAEIDGRPADVAFHNNGGIRARLAKGPITFGQLYEVLPFDNQLMALDLSGEQVREILEHSVANAPGKLQVSGLAFTFDMDQPVGRRVVAVTVDDAPLDPARVYRVTTIDYLAAGGDGYQAFTEGENVAYGDTEVWVVAEYIGEHSPVDPRVEGRIRQE